MNGATLAGLHPEAWDKIEKAGFVSLAEMAKRFTGAPLMDGALGYVSATRKWNRGHLPSPDAERRAKVWLESQRTEAPASPSDGDMFIVVCPEGTASKARRLLTFLGCEVETI